MIVTWGSVQDRLWAWSRRVPVAVVVAVLAASAASQVVQRIVRAAGSMGTSRSIVMVRVR